MAWSYRVIRHVDSRHSVAPAKQVGFSIREVYYDDEDRMNATTKDPSSPYGDTLEELRNDLKHMLEALDAPVVNWDDIPEKGATPIDENTGH